MGWFDYVSDLYSSVSIQSASADISDDLHSASGDFNSSKDQQGGMGTAQQTRGATTKGGVSTAVPSAGTNEESSEEAEVNKSDKKAAEPSGEKGHTPGEGGAASGQVGRDNAGPHGGPVGKQTDDDEEEADEAGDDEEEEEEDEPVDPMPGLIEQCSKSQECTPHKHHYDHCVERVTAQQEEHGKATEDCVEEFFHLAHCASQCAAPKLFKQLK